MLNGYMIEDFLNFKITDMEETEETNPRLVVRVKTSYWYDNRGMYTKKEIKTLKRLTNRCDNFLLEDCSNIGADEVFPRVINIDTCEDGIYEVITCHERDWETGYIEDYEDYDYKLIPYAEEKKT